MPPHRVAPWLLVYFIACMVPVVVLPLWSGGAFWGAMAVLWIGWVFVCLLQAYQAYVIQVHNGNWPGTSGTPTLVLAGFIFVYLFLWLPMTALLIAGVATLLGEERDKLP